jgi:hypothetical protein
MLIISLKFITDIQLTAELFSIKNKLGLGGRGNWWRDDIN